MVDLTGLLPTPVPDQGPRPVCLPISVTGAHDAVCASNGEAPRAAEALWRTCVNNGASYPEGTFLSAVLDAVAHDGQPASADWPFDIGLGIGTQEPPPACGFAPWRTEQFRELTLAHDGVEDALEDSLEAGLCVVLVIEITDEFCFPDAAGIVGVPDLTADVGDYHAVLVVGAVTSAARGRHLLVRNSWGPGWARGGYCWLSMKYLENFAVQAAIADL